MPQYICRYEKGEPLRWIGHLDLKRTLERALRRASFVLELSQGHNPHPKLSFGPPLPLGATGGAEVFAVHLAEPLLAGTFKERLAAQLPPGFELSEVWIVPGYKKKETFGDLDVAEYQVRVETDTPRPELERRVQELLARDEVTVSRGGERPEREVDLRPMILSLRVEEGEPGWAELHMRLRTGSHGGARPQELVELLGLDVPERLVRIHRTTVYVGGEAPPARPQPAPRLRWGRRRGG
jgi:radical SAM-linked protein